MQVRPSASPPRVLVIGAGVAGLSAAAWLAHAGLEVRVLEAASGPGGKMGRVAVGPHTLDAGPTVLTMRWVFDTLFEHLGSALEQHLTLRPCEVLARHAWGPAEQLDLLADLEQSVAAIAQFSGPAEAGRYRQFCARAQEIYQTLQQPFLCSPRPTPLSLAWRVGWRRLPQLLRISPFTTLWQALGSYFQDPRLRQLFGRYATYCGSSPFEAPATLMLVAHVEREAVWQVEGGMFRLALALEAACRRRGVRLDYGRPVRQILLQGRRACGVEIADGERLEADVVLFNGDAAALSAGLLGTAVQQALGARSVAGRRPSLSALTWHFEAQASGFELSHHNVFFSDPAHEGYRREFDALASGRLPSSPTVYVCAQDRGAARGPGGRSAHGPERLMCLVNAPAAAGRAHASDEELARCQDQMIARLAQSGLRLHPGPQGLIRTTPQDFSQRYPGTGGALYGAASHGWQASFRRPAHLTCIPGLYLAGGSVHPGPGVPMAALSGQLAALQIGRVLGSTRRWLPAPMPGGMSMR